jgi:flagellar biosynthesis protein FlhG
MLQHMSYDRTISAPGVIALGADRSLLGRGNGMQVIAITGGKGGVGKTNIAVNLAVSMSMEGLDVMLFDADLGLANVDVVLGMKPKYTLADVVSGDKTLADVVVDGPEGVRVIPAASGVAQMVEMQSGEQETLIRQLSDQLIPPDVLIVDTGAGIDQTVQTFVAACQSAVLVVCDEPASLTDAYALMKVLRAKKDIRRFEILANQVDNPLQGKQLFERIANVCDRYLDVELGYLGGVPTDMYLRRAVQERRALVSAYPRSPAAIAIHDAGRRLNRQAPRSESSGVGFFVEQLLSQQNHAVRH